MVSQLVERIRQKDQRAMSQLYQLLIGLLPICAFGGRCEGRATEQFREDFHVDTNLRIQR